MSKKSEKFDDCVYDFDSSLEELQCDPEDIEFARESVLKLLKVTGEELCSELASELAIASKAIKNINKLHRKVFDKVIKKAPKGSDFNNEE